MASLEIECKIKRTIWLELFILVPRKWFLKLVIDKPAAHLYINKKYSQSIYLKDIWERLT